MANVYGSSDALNRVKILHDMKHIAGLVKKLQDSVSVIDKTFAGSVVHDNVVKLTFAVNSLIDDLDKIGGQI